MTEFDGRCDTGLVLAFTAGSTLLRNGQLSRLEWNSVHNNRSKGGHYGRS